MNGGFWSRYPDTEPEFLSHVRDPGIRASVKLEFSPGTNINPEYRGTSAAKLRRLLERWRAEGQIPEDVDWKAMKSYEADLDAWNDAYQAAVERVRDGLPAPLFGCHWVRDMGGLIATRTAGGKSVPQRLSFRLWRNDLGYMPGSE